MSGVKTTMVGADEAYYHAIAGTSSRVITFPDAKPRLITLKKRYWDVLDMMHEKKGYAKNHIPSLAWQATTERYSGAPEFEEMLRWTFAYLLKLNMSYVMKDDGDWVTANEDDLGSSAPAPRLSVIFASVARPLGRG